MYQLPDDKRCIWVYEQRLGKPRCENIRGDKLEHCLPHAMFLNPGLTPKLHRRLVGDELLWRFNEDKRGPTWWKTSRRKPR